MYSCVYIFENCSISAWERGAGETRAAQTWAGRTEEAEGRGEKVCIFLSYTCSVTAFDIYISQFCITDNLQCFTFELGIYLTKNFVSVNVWAAFLERWRFQDGCLKDVSNL